MVYTVDGVQYTRRIKILVTGAASGAQTDFQIKLAATWAAAMQADFDDVRFTKADFQTLIDAWLESKVDSISANIWVEFLNTPADGVEKTEAYMYFGNAGAASDWDGAATFPSLFDHFEGSDIDAGKWQEITAGGSYGVSGSVLSVTGGADTNIERIESLSTFAAPIILRTRSNLQATDASYEISTVLFNTLSGAASAIKSNQIYSSAGGQGVIAGDETNYGISTQTVHGAWNIFEIVRTDSATSFYKNDALLTTLNYDNVVSRYIQITSRNLQVTQSDWILLRKYAANPPTAAFGTEEHQRRTPMMM